MLQSIRDNAQGVFVWIIVGVIIVAFALFGLGSYLSGATKIIAASVNGVDISETTLTRKYQERQEELKKIFGAQYRPEMFNPTRIKSDVLQGLITQEVMTQMILDQNYNPSLTQVFEKIKQYEAFQEDGKFTRKRYDDVLALQNINEKSFVNDISLDIASKQIHGAITQSAFLTATEKKVLSVLQNQKREIGYFNIAVQPYKKSIVVSEEDIKSFYTKNNHLFLTQEKVQIEYLELKMDDVAALQDVTDEMIKLQYDSSPENYMSNDEVAARKKATSLLVQIKKGVKFSELAKKHSQDKGSAKQGGDLGYLTRGGGEAFDNVVFALKKGEVSQVIKSKAGFQIIKVDDIRTGDPEERKVRHILIKAEKKLKSLAMVKESIRKELRYQLAGKIFFDDADKLNNLSYETPDSLEPVANALGLKVKTTALMTRRGGAGLFANPKVLSAMFSQEVLNEGRNSELLEISDSHLVVLRMKVHQASSVQALEKIKPQIKNNLLQEQASKKVAEISIDILTRLKNNENIQSIEKRYSEIKWNKKELITRRADPKSKITSQLRQYAFTLPKPDKDNTSWGKLTLAAGNQAVVGLYKVEQASDIKLMDDTSRFARVRGDADYNSFVSYVRSQADISITPVVSEQ